MRIDPSTIKQLLQLQLQQGLNAVSETGSGFTSSETGGSDFTALLEALLSQSGQASANKIIPASELLARTASPAALFANPLSTAGASTPTDYESYIQDSSTRHGVESSLVKAVIQAESDFDAKAVSKAGAKGLMQLMDGTGEGLGVKNPFDPQQNIEGGTRFLSGLMQKYNGNVGVVLAAYNAGPARVDRLGIKSDADLRDKLHLLPRETQNYVNKVLAFKDQFQA